MTWKLPEASDPDGDKFSVSVDTEKAPWLTFDEELGMLIVDGSALTPAEVGVHEIKVTLTDTFWTSAHFTQTIEVVETESDSDSPKED